MITELLLNKYICISKNSKAQIKVFSCLNQNHVKNTALQDNVRLLR